MQSATNLINPLHHVHFKNFHQYVRARGGTLCAGVKDRNGKFYVIGDRGMMTGELQDMANKDRRESRELIPKEKPLPKLPMPLSELLRVDNRNKRRQCASALVQHFLEEGQHLGKVE